MDKVKWGLRAVTFCCIMVPLLYTVMPNVLTNNYLGIIVPPQLQTLVDSVDSGQAGDLNSTLPLLGVNPVGLQAPRFESLTFDDSTGVATLKLKLTNPLTRQRITINKLNFTVANGTRSFTVQLNERVRVEANQTGVLSFPFSSSDPQALQSLVDILNGVERPSYADDLQLSSLYIDINGMVVQASDLGKLSELFGGKGP